MPARARSVAPGALMRLPVLGQIAKHRTRAVFTRTLQLLNHAAVPADGSWETACAAVPNLYLGHELRRGLASVRATARFSPALQESLLFDPADAGVVATGESVGDIEQSLELLAGRYEEDTRVALGGAVVRGAITFTLWGFLLGAVASALFAWAYGSGVLKLMDGIME